MLSDSSIKRLELMKRKAKDIMMKISIAESIAWIRTLLTIKRHPYIHTIITTAIPPTISWICPDHKDVCELFLYNLMDELESLGLTGLIQIVDKKYIVNIYENLTL